MSGKDTENGKTKSVDQQQRQRLHIDLLFSKYVTRYLADELMDIASFFDFLSDGIVPDKLTSLR